MARLQTDQLNATIDISPIVYGRGVSRYTMNLVSALRRQHGVNIHAFGSSLRQLSELKQFVHAQKLTSVSTLLPFPPKLMSKLFYAANWPSIETLLSKKTDVFHAWEELIPPSNSTPIVATIHDLAMLKFPETAHQSTLEKHHAAWKRLKKLKSHVIAVSQATKKDVIELLEFQPDHVHLVYEALPEEHRVTLTKEQRELHLKKLRLDRPFILFVGAMEPRKNVLRLIEAWQTLADEVDLVLAGRNEWGVELPTNVSGLHVLGSVSSEQLASLYTEAKVFTFPSLYEGFGLPILEAFYYGTPVLTSENSAMSEISGTAARLVNPLEVESIAKGLQQLLDENSTERAKRKQAMKLQLQLFHWDKTAEKTLTVYKKAVTRC